MGRTRSALLTLACLTIACASLPSQTVRNVSPTAPTEKPEPVRSLPVPFAINGNDSGRLPAVAFRTADQMSVRDRDAAENAGSAIAAQAKYSGLEFNQGKWSYEQVVCTALPEHLFLRFTRNNGTGDLSLFTASIPRGNEGRVRIIPIQLRGYSLFSPAPVNAITISAFNHIRAEENRDRAPVPDWLGTGLCYAALAGGNPQLPPIGQDQAHLQTLSDGTGAVISFDDVSKASSPVKWTMTFDAKGKLLKATHAKADLLKTKSLHPAAVDQAGKPVPAIPPAQPKKVTPPAPSVVVLHPSPIPDRSGPSQ
jgi:hypothetical protein